MKKYDVLKVVVIVQALGMVALSAFVIWNFFPYVTTRHDNGNAEQVPSDQDTGSGSEVIAEIADRQITKYELIDELLELYGDQALEQMLIHQAIDMAARDRGIKLSSSELNEAIVQSASGYDSPEQYFLMMKDTLGLSQNRVIQDIKDHALLVKIALHEMDISEEQITAYLNENKEMMEPKQRLDLRWIVSEELEDAENMMMRLSQGASFSELAQVYSIDIYSAADGGRLGEIDSDDPFYDEQLLDEAMQLQIGDIAGPIEISKGFAVIQLLGRQSDQRKSEQQLRDWAKTELALQQAGPLATMQQELLNQYVTVIRK